MSFDLVNLNSTSSWFIEHPPEDKLLDVVCVSQIERDTVIVCYDSKYLNSTSSWFIEHPPEDKLLDVVCVSQIERDTVIVCYDSKYKQLIFVDRNTQGSYG